MCTLRESCLSWALVLTLVNPFVQDKICLQNDLRLNGVDIQDSERGNPLQQLQQRVFIYIYMYNITHTG